MGVLVAMVVIASLQALFFNIAERNIGWAQSVLENLDWVDAFLQKGTLWLAFIGASLATYHDKHISIDVLQRLMKPPVRRVMQIVGLVGAGGVAFLLSKVFYDACLVADASVPFEYEMLTTAGPQHVCDVLPEQLGDATRPMLLCGLRSAFAAVGVPITSGGGAAQLITPLMFFVIGVRLFARAVVTGLTPPGAEPSEAATEPAKSESDADATKDEPAKAKNEPAKAKDEPADDESAESGKSTDES